MTTATATSPIDSWAGVAHLRRATFWGGFLLFYLNHWVDARLGIPLGEFVLLGVLFLSFVRQQKMLLFPGAQVALLLTLLLTMWTAGLDYYHSGSVGHALRVLIRGGLFYLLLVGFLMLADKRRIFTICVGFLAGYCAFFVFSALYFVVAKPSGFWFALKYILPTPAVILALVWFQRKALSHVVWLGFIGFLGFALVSMPIIGSRGALLSLMVGLGFAGMVGALKLPRGVMVASALLLPLLPVFVGAFFYVPGSPERITDPLYQYDKASHSNVERALMIHMGIETMREAPLIGIGSHAAIETVEPVFTFLTDLPAATGESPHNYYLEFSMPFGLPALVMIMMLLWIFYMRSYEGVRMAGLPLSAAAFTIGVVGWIMLYQPVAGITRLEVIMLLYFALSGMNAFPVRGPVPSPVHSSG